MTTITKPHRLTTWPSRAHRAVARRAASRPRWQRCQVVGVASVGFDQRSSRQEPGWIVDANGHWRHQRREVNPWSRSHGMREARGHGEPPVRLVVDLVEPDLGFHPRVGSPSKLSQRCVRAPGWHGCLSCAPSLARTPRKPSIAAAVPPRSAGNPRRVSRFCHPNLVAGKAGRSKSTTKPAAGGARCRCQHWRSPKPKRGKSES